MIKKILLIMMGVLILSSLVSADSGGCCFDPDTGLCSLNTLSEDCETPGEFYSSPSCSVSKCDKGCCILGPDAQYTTSPQCGVLSGLYGFDFDFTHMDEASCTQLADSLVMGACVYSTGDCVFTEAGGCINGDFYNSTLCTDPSLNTTCEKTFDSTCYNEDVYYLDDCGNPDTLKEDCDFDTGTICRPRERATGSYCKNLNCGSWINGQSWCSMGGAAAIGRFIWKPVSESNGNLVILYDGSIGATIFGPDGKMIETGNSLGAAYGDFGEVVRFSKTGSAYPANLQVHLGGAVCIIASPGSRTEKCVSPEGETVSGSGIVGWAVGSRFFREYCQDGLVIVEPCADFRMESCHLGECEINPWEECVSANGFEGESAEGEEAPAFDRELCNEEFCSIKEWKVEPEEGEEGAEEGEVPTSGGIAGAVQQAVQAITTATPTDPYTECSDPTTIASKEAALERLKMCAPKIAPGLQFYSGSTFGGLSNSEGKDSVCSTANFKASATFRYKRVKKTHSSTKRTWKCESYGDEDLPGSCIYFDECLWVNSPHEKGVLKETFGNYLINTCRALGDCDGKSNWLAAEGGGEGYKLDVKQVKTWSSSSRRLLSGAIYRSIHKKYYRYEINFECKIWEAPASGECGECGGDGYECSEYRCKAIGENCEYKEAGGVDGGFCIASNDGSAPEISCANCPKQIPPYSAAQFTINTNEVAQCKFEIGKKGEGYSSMQYDLGFDWNTKHSTILFVPGQIPDKIIHTILEQGVEEEFEAETGEIRSEEYTVSKGQTINVDIPYDKDWVIEAHGNFDSGGFNRHFTSPGNIDFFQATTVLSQRLSNRNIFFIDAMTGTVNEPASPSDHFLLSTPLTAGGSHTFKAEYFSLDERFRVTWDGVVVADAVFETQTQPSPMNTINMDGFSGIWKYTVRHPEFATRAADVIEPTEYDVINREGFYQMYVRCKDAAGNSNKEPFLIEFEVDPTPDTSPPVIIGFEPVDGSSVKHNTTTKRVVINLNEPAECKWDFEDKDYEDMAQSINCTTMPTDYSLTNGYSCVETFYNVTKDMSKQTKYYIRCKDQAWLEGNESKTYSRNVNEESTEYILRPSEALEIFEISPSGKTTLPSSNTSLELGVLTIKGAIKGKAVCAWRLEEPSFNMTGYRFFTKTNSSSHKQILFNKTKGKYKVYVKCTDAAGNQVSGSSSFQVDIDDKGPEVTRAYNKGSVLTIITNEESQCKYTFNDDLNCLFDWENENVSTMFGAAKYHTANWEDDQTYYIRCKDYHDNENKGCAMVVRAY